MASYIEDFKRATRKLASEVPATFEVRMPKALAGNLQFQSEYATWFGRINSKFLTSTGVGLIATRSPQMGIVNGIAQGSLEAVRYDYRDAARRVKQAANSGVVSISNPLYTFLDFVNAQPKDQVEMVVKELRDVAGIPMSKAWNIAQSTTDNNNLVWSTSQ